MRCHRNKIRCIKDAAGNWLTEENEIKKHTRLGFKKLYTTELGLSTISSDVSDFSCCCLIEEPRLIVKLRMRRLDPAYGLSSLSRHQDLMAFTWDSTNISSQM